MTTHHEHADVLVIGAGASGAVVAKHMSENGFSVVALEQGTWVDNDDLPGTRAEYELATMGRWSADPNMRAGAADYPVDQSDSDGPPVQMYNGVGGGTVLFAAVWPRPTPADFLVRTLDGVADDWPFGYSELQPYFEATDIEFGASGLGGNPAYPPGAPPPLPALPIAATGRTAAEGMNALGWHWWPASNAIASRAHGHQSQCVRYGTCIAGCPEGAKGSTDVTHWPNAIANGAELITGARVREVTLDDAGRANGAIWIDRDGNERFQSASLVVMAANGIGTPRILLMSRSSRFPEGLANSSGLVGKRLMLHPCATVAGIFDDEFDEMGPSGQKISSMEFYETEASRGFVRGGYWTLYDGVGPHLHVLRRVLGEEVGEEPFWGASFAPTMKEYARHTVMWGIVGEDLPEEHNTVTLDPEATDSDGLPAAKVSYRLSQNTKDLIDFNCDRAGEALEAAGAKRTFAFGRNVPAGHLLGTARMGTDPGTSVVDEWGRSHDVPNLYVVDGSVFVTGFGVNPTSSIAAIAKRTATHLVATASNQEVAS